ncbi:16S rRNA (guanine(966)-N(2))-methyltransferase RsmD [Endozoicomonas sp. OPT23]|uniref:16S rRNA (guanine(966)-N(2))-methyltransferase RsmD n=1 Tax=Endozoicomonas sp. OPT23 TaxID=2072845 RepID=UPI00129B3627|nr:16S rRNA (guanine(966)-N(2))-methyltransferase RsmD [Endozoicomonas sp. OPT23]MRI32519.1 16S rRNA (guanine(966)-N(2))-methyltransferase RsmD [Endozoicomonas sp. OPT23]
MPRRPSTKRQNASKGSGQLRIIGGEWCSRRLPVADLPGLRPTSDRVRETVFNWLLPYVPGAKVLDCFTGSGSLSLEALSRGAGSATMLEFAAPAAKVLKENLTTLRTDKASVVQTDALIWLSKKADEPFDLVFLDPPFRKGFLEKTCQLLNDNGYVSDQTLVYIEVEKELSPLPIPDHWSLLKTKTAGQLSYHLLQVETPDE